MKADCAAALPRDLRRRFARRPVELVWAHEVATWSEALREEARIKRLRRAAKETLAAGGR